MEFARRIYVILRGILYAMLILAAVVLIIFVCAGCGGSNARTYAPKQYEGRFVHAGNSGYLHTYIDTETGICYAVTGKGGICVMLDHDGKPYVANGWRDE